MILMLPINHSARGFYRIDIQALRGLDEETIDIVKHINSTWSDIEYLHFLFHKIFGSLSDDREMEHTFSALVVYSENFYVHLSIISKLFAQLSKKSDLIQKLHSGNEHIFKRIDEIRNTVIVHCEKPNFKQIRGSISATDPKHLIEHRIATTDHKGKSKNFILKPIQDINLVYKIIQNADRLLQTEVTRLSSKS